MAISIRQERISAGRIRELLLVLCLLGFTAIITGNAWLSDDAYITFRTVDNFANGYGLRWNTAERVQAYTHPLWLFVLAAAYFFTHEIYFTSLSLSLALSVIAVLLLSWRVARSAVATVGGIVILTVSHAFVDYSTSGLENPLTHLLLAAFLVVYLRHQPDLRRLFHLSLLAGLGMVNRIDTGLLFLPPLILVLWQTRQPTAARLRVVAAGFMPLALWQGFSLLYYGFLFPNTAYAKLNLGIIEQSELLRQGVYYFWNSLRWDPITLGTIFAAVAAAFAWRERRRLVLVAGVLLYLAYVLWIGGDFMSGRFFAAPLLIAVAILMHIDVRAPWSLALVTLLALSLFFGLRLPVPAPPDPQWVTDEQGITNEKANYWYHTGLLRPDRTPAADHEWAHEGQAARQQQRDVVMRGSVGFYGFFAGPDVFVIDLLGLADPLLARLPPSNPLWRVGHYGRQVPAGYVETVATGVNQIQDADLALYYDQLLLALRGKLLDPRRLQAIWDLNRGLYDPYLEAFAFAMGESFVQTLTFTNPSDSAYVYTYVWNNETAEAYLLDDRSQQGDEYVVTWTVTADTVHLDGVYLEQIAAIGPMSDDTTLNMGVFFADTPERPVYDIYEYRYWFQIRPDRRLVVIRQAESWHNPEAPGGLWLKGDVSQVVR